MKASRPGVHIEEEEQEEEVDNSVRGRLLRLLERVKKFREKRVEEEPEPQEDTKPSELYILCRSHTPANTAICSLLQRHLFVLFSRYITGADFPYYDPLGPGVIYPES